MILQDVIPLCPTLDESGRELPNGRLRITGKFQHCGVVNRNGRIYPKHVWESHLRPDSTFMKAIKARKVFGHIEHPQSGKPDLNLAAICITDLYLKENEVWGTLETLSSEHGKHAASLFRDGLSVGISSRAEGSTRVRPDGIHEVCDDFVPRTFDLVAEPSTPGAELRESLEHRLSQLNDEQVRQLKIDELLARASVQVDHINEKFSKAALPLEEHYQLNDIKFSLREVPIGQKVVLLETISQLQKRSIKQHGTTPRVVSKQIGYLVEERKRLPYKIDAQIVPWKVACALRYVNNLRENSQLRIRALANIPKAANVYKSTKEQYIQYLREEAASAAEQALLAQQEISELLNAKETKSTEDEQLLLQAKIAAAEAQAAAEQAANATTEAGVETATIAAENALEKVENPVADEPMVPKKVETLPQTTLPQESIEKKKVTQLKETVGDKIILASDTPYAISLLDLKEGKTPSFLPQGITVCVVEEYMDTNCLCVIVPRMEVSVEVSPMDFAPMAPVEGVSERVIQKYGKRKTLQENSELYADLDVMGAEYVDNSYGLCDVPNGGWKVFIHNPTSASPMPVSSPSMETDLPPAAMESVHRRILSDKNSIIKEQKKRISTLVIENRNLRLLNNTMVAIHEEYVVGNAITEAIAKNPALKSYEAILRKEKKLPKLQETIEQLTRSLIIEGKTKKNSAPSPVHEKQKRVEILERHVKTPITPVSTPAIVANNLPESVTLGTSVKAMPSYDLFDELAKRKRT